MMPHLRGNGTIKCYVYFSNRCSDSSCHRESNPAYRAKEYNLFLFTHIENYLQRTIIDRALGCIENFEHFVGIHECAIDF